MHPLFSRADELTGQIIAAGIEVHRTMGPGLLESIYERCLLRELELRGLRADQQQCVRVQYKQITFEEQLRYDLLVEGCVLVEAKAVQAVEPIHKAQLLSYMKLMDVPLGLVMNFHEIILTAGIHRMMLPGANRP